MKKTLASEAQNVYDYLTAYAYMLVDVANDKAVCQKDKKWLRKRIVSILETQNVLDIAVAHNEVMKKYKPKERKRMVKILAEFDKEKK